MTHTPAPADHDDRVTTHLQQLRNAAGLGTTSPYDTELEHIARNNPASTIVGLAMLLANLRERADRAPQTIAGMPVAAYVKTEEIAGCPGGVAITEDTRVFPPQWAVFTVMQVDGAWVAQNGHYDIADWRRAIDLMAEKVKDRG
jgi:hypothetical protein